MSLTHLHQRQTVLPPVQGAEMDTVEEKTAPAHHRPGDYTVFAEQQEIPSGVPAQREPAENKTGMPDSLKTGLESLSGQDLSDVKVHYNSSEPAKIQAKAYTQGTDIHVAPGQEQHLAHEGWHAVQQKQGRVQATTQAKGKPVNDEKKLEHEADVMGAKAASLPTGGAMKQPAAAQMMPAGAPAQRMAHDDDKKKKKKRP